MCRHLLLLPTNTDNKYLWNRGRSIAMAVTCVFGPVGFPSPLVERLLRRDLAALTPATMMHQDRIH